MSDENIDQNIKKKELYELERARRQRAKKDVGQGRFGKRLLLWGIVLVLLGGGIWALAAIVRRAPAIQPLTLISSISPSDWQRGNGQSGVVLIEYGDFQCPACGVYYSLVEQINKDFGGQIQFVFRNFPLSQHPNAIPAAKAAGAAGAQGKFWEMYGKIYENQLAWSDLSDAKSVFDGYAKSIGLNMDQFEKDFDAASTQNKIDDDLNGGIAAGVNSTPTFFLNGKRIQPNNYDEFKNLITAAIEGNS